MSTKHKRASEGREALLARLSGGAKPEVDPNPVHDLNELDYRAVKQMSGSEGTAYTWEPIERVVSDPQLQVRAGGLDPQKVEEYFRHMWAYLGWGDFPALDLYLQDDRDDLLVSDGHHRYAAAQLYNQEVERLVTEGDMQELGGRDYITHVKSVVKPGGFWMALQNAGLANLRNGMALKVEDKVKFLADMLRPDNPFSWMTLSHRQMAEKLGVSPTTIGNWLERLQLSSDWTVEPQTRTVGKDGKVRDTSKIRKANKLRKMAPLERNQRALINHLLKAADLMERLGEKGSDAHTLRARADVLRHKWGIDDTPQEGE